MSPDATVRLYDPGDRATPANSGDLPSTAASTVMVWKATGDHSGHRPRPSSTARRRKKPRS
jgi:hypothetical protein